MFTGLIETLGTVQRVQAAGSGTNLVVEAATLASELTVGESIAVNGACLSVVEHDQRHCRFQAGPETLLRTNLGELVVGDRVNLERSLRLGDRLGGHIVLGHVDGVGRIAQRLPEGEWQVVWFSCPEELARQMVSKGSVAVDGISLTLVEVGTDRFSVALIPHTLAQTTLGFKSIGAAVNLETDLLAKHVFKFMQIYSGKPLPAPLC
jgi:riboflavin synthase